MCVEAHPCILTLGPRARNVGVAVALPPHRGFRGCSCNSAMLYKVHWNMGARIKFRTPTSYCPGASDTDLLCVPHNICCTGP